MKGKTVIWKVMKGKTVIWEVKDERSEMQEHSLFYYSSTLNTLSSHI